LTIDLSGVTHLGSAGVSALAAVRDRAREQGGDCVLIAPPGSPAHHILSMVQIPVSCGDNEDVYVEE
jgi:anti-anti-sigma regulatory factor